MKKYILALDQGTTSSRAIIFDKNSRIIGMEQKEFTQIYPHPGWVEHNPLEIWSTQEQVIKSVMSKTGISPKEIAAIGITNQRETTIVWDRKTGEPVYNAIVWQCRRTAKLCEQLRKDELTKKIQKKTGLVLDAYFSGTKVKWILDNVSRARKKAEHGDLVFGTVDSWVVWKLTKGSHHITDYTNASRTLLYNIYEKQWDKDILKALNIPASMLPEVRNSSEVYGTVKIQGSEIPIAGIGGDQQAALFGQGCFTPGSAKNTYGTGCFMLQHTGATPIPSTKGLLTTIAIGINDTVEYALEGSIFIAGAAVQWLRDELGLIHDAVETESLARRVNDTAGAYFVPAFAGLGSPYWDMYARGAIVGLTRGVNKHHLVRATLESIAYQTKDLISVMESESGKKLKLLKVDGGATNNNFLMQFQADILGVEVQRPKCIETTALGAGYLAGLAVGFWKNKNDITNSWKLDKAFTPAISLKTRKTLYHGWKRAVDRAKQWIE